MSRRAAVALAVAIGAASVLVFGLPGGGGEGPGAAPPRSVGANDAPSPAPSLLGRSTADSLVPLQEPPFEGEEQAPAGALGRGKALLEGMVTLEGLEVEGASVESRPKRPFQSLKREVARSGPDGRFRVPRVVGSSYVVSAALVRDEVRYFAQATYEDGQGVFELALDALSRVVDLRIVGVHGDPIEAVAVLPAARLLQGSAEVRTDVHGHVRLAGVPNSWFHVWVRHAEYVPRLFAIPPSASSGETLRVTMDPGVVVRLAVKCAESGKPIEGATVCPTGFGSAASTFTDERGLCALRVGAVQTAAIDLEAPAYVPRTVVLSGLERPMGSDAVYDIALASAARLEVRLPPSRSGGAVLVGRPKPDERLLGSATASAGGSAVFDNVPIGERVVVRVDFANGDRYLGVHLFSDVVSSEGVLLDLAAEENVPWYCRPRRIKVVGDVGSSRAAHGGVSVTIGSSACPSSLMRFSVRLRVGSEHEFLLPQRVAWTATINQQGGGRTEVPLMGPMTTLHVGGAPSSGLWIRGDVVDTYGDPVPDAVVFVVADNRTVGTARSDARGEWDVALGQRPSTEGLTAFAVTGSVRSGVVKVGPSADHAVRIVCEK